MNCRCCCTRCTHVKVDGSRCCECVPQFLCLTLGRPVDPLPVSAAGSFCLTRGRLPWVAETQQYVGGVTINGNVNVGLILRLVDDGYSCYWEASLHYTAGAPYEDKEEVFEISNDCDEFNFTIPLDLKEYTQAGGPLEKVACCDFAELVVTTYHAHRLPRRKCTGEDDTVYYCNRCECLPRTLCLERYNNGIGIGRYVLEATLPGVWEHGGFELRLVEEDGVCYLLWPDGLIDPLPSGSCFGWEITHTMYGTMTTYIVKDMNCCVSENPFAPSPCAPLLCQPGLDSRYVLLSQIADVKMEDVTHNIASGDVPPHFCTEMLAPAIVPFQQCSGGSSLYKDFVCLEPEHNILSDFPRINTNWNERPGCDPTYYSTCWINRVPPSVTYGKPAIVPPPNCAGHMVPVLWTWSTPPTPSQYHELEEYIYALEEWHTYKFDVSVYQEFFVHDFCIDQRPADRLVVGEWRHSDLPSLRILMTTYFPPTLPITTPCLGCTGACPVLGRDVHRLHVAVCQQGLISERLKMMRSEPIGLPAKVSAIEPDKPLTQVPQPLT